MAGNNASGDFNVKHYKGKFNAYQRTYVITVNQYNKLLYSYLNYQLVNHLKKFKEQSVGTNTKFLKIGMIQELAIPLPPLSEQQQIVSILNEAFAAIGKAKENVQRNLQNAKELFHSELNSIFSKKGDGWVDKKLGEISEYKKTPNKRKDLPYIGLENIESNTGKFIGSYDAQEVKSTTFYFSNKHVLYGRLRPYLNKVLLPDFEGHCSTEIFPILVSKELERGFLFYWLISSNTMEKINATWTGARMPRANMNEVANFKLSYPPLKTQQKIVHQLDTLSAETKKLEIKYQQKLNNLEELKKSILQKAFSGELTKTNCLA